MSTLGKRRKDAGAHGPRNSKDTTHSPFPFGGSGKVCDLKHLRLGLREGEGEKDIEPRGCTRREANLDTGIGREQTPHLTVGRHLEERQGAR